MASGNTEFLRLNKGQTRDPARPAETREGNHAPDPGSR